MYYNTTNAAGMLLSQYEAKAIRQNDAIALFMGQSKGAQSPSQVWQELFKESVPITSVRRAMTSLSDEGVLEKLDATVQGPFGRPEHCWRFRAINCKG